MQPVYQMGGYLSRQSLALAEWLAENAYVAPGAHRLMTATGLMGGLVTGRFAMNVLTAQDNRGKPTHQDEVPLPLRPFHGAYGYQRFDDTPAARWHQVVYDVVPIALGGVGAMIGSTRYSRTTRFATSLAKDLGEGKFGLTQACMLSSKVQARTANMAGGMGFGFGSSSGGAMFPLPIFSTAWNAVRFQLENGKKPMLWGLRSVTGNRAPRSRDLYTSVMDMIDWAQSNAAYQTGKGWHNHAPHIEELSQAVMQNVPHATAEHLAKTGEWIAGIAQRVDARAAHLKAAATSPLSAEKLRAALKEDAACRDMMRELSDIDGHYIRLGIIDVTAPEKSGVTIGDHGLITAAAKHLGAKQHLASIEKLWHQSIRHRANPDLVPAPVIPSILTSYNDFTPKVIGFGAAGAGAFTAMALLGSNAKCPALSDEEKQSLRAMPRHEADARYHQIVHGRASGLGNLMNGKPLDVAEWTASVAAAAPNLHRFMNAACLSAFLYTGAKFSTALAARGLRGEPLAEAAVWPIFKPIYGKMQYAWKSADMADRWKWAAHQIIPVAVGAAGTYAGSHIYFGHKERKLRQPTTLEDTTEAILMHESESFSKTSALTSILNTGSGFHLLPFASYGSNLNNRFMMANGQQVCTPLLGGWWSGNPSHYPEHVKLLLERLVDCAVASPSEYPSEFRPITHAILAKLYPSLPKAELGAHIDQFLDTLYEVRDPFWKEGGVPEDQQSALRSAMTARFRGTGLEETLRTIGLNPLEAELDHNGASGTLAKWLGAGSHVAEDIASYRTHAVRRQKEAPGSHVTDAKDSGRVQPSPVVSQRA